MNQPVSAIFLSTAGNLGGAERGLFDILSGFRESEPSWNLRVVSAADGPLVGELKSLGIPTTVLRYPRTLERIGDSGTAHARSFQRRFKLMSDCLFAGPGAVAYALRLHRLMARNNPDIVHASGFKMQLLSSWASPKNAALIWHIQDYVQPRPMVSALLRRRAGRCHRALVNSKSVERDLTDHCSGIRAQTVYYGIDLQRFTPHGATADLDRLSGLPPAAPGTLRVGLVATFARWKGHLIFLRALASLPKDLAVRGYIIGADIYHTAGSQFTREELQREAARLGLENRVGFTGFCLNQSEVLRSLDVVVHASTQPEPFGLVIVEAMACGKPLIVSEAGGPLEIVTLGRNALGHAPGSSEQLAERLQQLAASADLRAAMGREARIAAESRFDRNRMTAEMVSIYRSIRDRKMP